MLSYFCYPPAPFYLHFRSWPTYIPCFTLTIIQSLLWKTQYPISLSAFIITAKITQPSIISVTAPQQLQRVMQMGRKTAETNHHKLVGLKYNRKVCVCVCVCVRARARACTHSVMSDSLWPLGLLPCQAPLSMEFSRQVYWSGLPFPTPGDLLDLGVELVSSVSPELAGRFFTTVPPGKPS